LTTYPDSRIHICMDWMTIKQVAEETGLKIPHIYRLISQGKIGAEKVIGAGYRVSREELDRFRREHTVPADLEVVTDDELRVKA